MSGRRKSDRNASKVNYAEPAHVAEDEDEKAPGSGVGNYQSRAKRRQVKQDLKEARKKRKKDDDADPAWNSAKNKKKTAKKYKDAGKLSNLLEMPIDILASVFSKLEPLSLLYLTRSNKQLRSWLLSNEAISIWKASHDNMTYWKEPRISGSLSSDEDDDVDHELTKWQAVRMPAKPENLNYADHARLLFEKVCFDCGADKAVTFENFTLSLRLCRGCSKTRILRYYKAERALKAKYGKGKVHEQVFDIALSMSGHGYGFMVNNKYYHSYDINNLFEMHDLYIEKKKNLDEDELTIWMEECNTQNRAKEEAGDVIKDWLTDYQRYGKDDVRQANARKRDVHRRRETQIRNMAMGQDFYDASLWRDFSTCAQAQRLFNKDMQFDVAEEWPTMLPIIRREFELRAAYKDTFRAFDAKSPARDWIYSQYLRTSTAVEGLPIYLLTKGEVLDLTAVVPFLEKETLKFEDEEAAEASLSKRYERFTERQKQVEAAWLRKWNDQVAEINQEAEQARLSVLLDIAEKLAAAYPDRQRKPEECLHVVQAEKGDDVKATDYMLALYNEMQGLHAILGCGGCDQGNARHGLRLGNLIQHTHFSKIYQARSYKHRHQPNYVGYTDNGRNIDCAWRSELVYVPADMLFATNLLVTACERYIARQRSLSEEEMAKQSEMGGLPETAAAFDDNWRFVCEHPNCKTRYVWYYRNERQSKWDTMLLHVQEHYMAAQNFRDTLIAVGSVKVHEKPKPIQQVAVPKPASLMLQFSPSPTTSETDPATAV